MDVQRSDPKLRVVALVVVGTALVLGVALWVVLQRWFAALAHLPAADAQALLLMAFAWAFGSICFAVLWLGVSFLRAGTRVRRVALWPLPGTRVIRDTPVLRGDAAVARGRLMQVAAVALFLCAAAIGVVAWRLYHVFAAAV